jgi:hypothetical protein
VHNNYENDYAKRVGLASFDSDSAEHSKLSRQPSSRDDLWTAPSKSGLIVGRGSHDFAVKSFCQLVNSASCIFRRRSNSCFSLACCYTPPITIWPRSRERCPRGSSTGYVQASSQFKFRSDPSPRRPLQL